MTTRYGVEKVLYKTLEKRRNKLKHILKIIAKFYELFSPKANIAEIVHTITKGNIESSSYCQEEITLKYLQTFLKTSRDCEQSLVDFFKCFRKEYRGI